MHPSTILPRPASQRALVPHVSAQAASRLTLLLGLGLGVWLGLAQLVPPAVVPATAPTTEFSAERALQSLQVIAQAPRPLGSPGAAAVRDTLVRQITALGLTPEIQTTTVVNRFPSAPVFMTGQVQNVVARLPGTASTGAIVLDGHYDAASTGPGAADCGACVVTLLETMRALKAGPPLRNDVVFVFADGEENGDLGAEAFAAAHPWMRDVRLALNFEAQGAGGYSLMYFTSPHNGWLMGEFLKSAPHPLAHSFFATLLSQFFAGAQLGCDLEEFTSRGVAGLDFAILSDTAAYHTQRDNPQTIDGRSIQHHGDYALPLTRHFGNLDLTAVPTTPNAVFFTVLPGVVARYSETWTRPLAGLFGLLFLALVVLGFRQRHLSLGGVIVGMLAFVVSAVTALVLVVLLWAGLKAASADLRVPMIGAYQTDLFLVGFGLLVTAVMAGVYTWLLRRTRAVNLTTGALLVWGGLMVLTSLAAPGMSYVFTWPFAFALPLLAWQLHQTETQATPWRDLAWLTLAAIPALVILIPLTVLLVPLTNRFDGLLNLPLAPVSTLFIALLAGLLIPHLQFIGRGSWRLPAVLLVMGLAVIAAGYAGSGFSADHPQPTSIAYELKPDSGQAVWISQDRDLNPWTAQFFPPGAATHRDTTYPFSGMPSFTAAAPVVALPAPDVRVLADTVTGEQRHVTLRLVSPRQAPYLEVQIDVQGEITAAALDGQPMDISATPGDHRRLRFTYAGLPAEGVELSLVVKSAGPITVWLRDGSTGLPTIPGMTIRPRPADMMPVSGPNVLDPTAVSRTVTLAP
ncbi:MAG: M28 family peptidase [Anaerolineae bacterium]|nr:M28 family peptidase [Anaerolineae bacterium]